MQSKDLVEEDSDSSCYFLTVYGLPEFRASGVRWIEFVRDWFAASGYLLDRVSGRSGIVSYNRVRSRVESEAEVVPQLSFFGGRRPGETFQMYDWQRVALLDRNSRMIVLGASRPEENLLEWSLEIVSKLSMIQNVNFGMAKAAGVDVGLFYSLGMIVAGECDEDEAGEIANWARAEAAGTCFGYLRDVYEVNFLSREALGIRVGNVELEAWIRSSANHGELLVANSELFLWRVADQHLDAVRGELARQNVLVALHAKGEHSQRLAN